MSSVAPTREDHSYDLQQEQPQLHEDHNEALQGVEERSHDLERDISHDIHESSASNVGHQEEHHFSQLLSKEMPTVPKQETNLSIDELDKMISDSINHDSTYLDSENREKRGIDQVEEHEAESNKRHRQHEQELEQLEQQHKELDQQQQQQHQVREQEQVHQEQQQEAQEHQQSNQLDEPQEADSNQQQSPPVIHQDHTKSNEDLELEFEKAIEKHHRESSAPPEGNNRNSENEERENLQMIASELQEATGTKPQSQQVQPEQQESILSGTQAHLISPDGPTTTEKDESRNLTSSPGSNEPVPNSNETENGEANDKTETSSTNDKEKEEQAVVLHDGINVPANSELLNTNTAYAAYNALSSQLPPLATLANAHLAALPLPIVAMEYLPPRVQLLINTLPTLDNLATQFLRIMAVGPFQKILDLTSNPGTPAGATFRDLASLLDFTKKLYSEEDLFLTVEHLAPGFWKSGERTPAMFRSREQSIELTLRKVNLATFLGAVLGMLEVGFYYLNESFLDVFCPANTLDPSNALSNMNSNNLLLQSGVNTTIGGTVGKLLKAQAVLYLDLKTQAYISAYENNDGRTREEIIEDLFPSDLEEIMLNRRGTKTLSSHELDFVERCHSRKDTLLKFNDNKALAEEYEWLTFLKELIEYSSKNMGFLIWGKRNIVRDNGIVSVTGTSVSATSNSTSANNNKQSDTPHSQDLLNQSDVAESIRQQEEIEAERQRVQDTIHSHDINDITSRLLPSEIQEQQIHLRINPRSSVRTVQRRPWTKEEELALRLALELKGPLWSTILELFGAGGKISEALKNRTQVQLKDKARNWKMFFLKNAMPLPKYLHKVTGDLEREDRMKNNKSKMNKKTAAAPVPPIQTSQK